MARKFIGRKNELKTLEQLRGRKAANFVIIQGRRRIGKSRLAAEFGKGHRYYQFTGLAPNHGTDASIQRQEFLRQLSEQCQLPKIQLDDWGDIFTLLANQVDGGEVTILFDEISWMGSKDKTFLAKLKNAWDEKLQKNPKLILLLCGSVSSWIEKNIISSTAFMGRPTLYMTLDELPLMDCNQFFDNSKISAYERLKMLAITGGVPRYLEMIDTKLNADENIRSLCFTKSSPLLDEFERIFSDIFGERSGIYRRISEHLAKGAASQAEILQALERKKNGDLSEYLKDLEMAGFIARDYSWHIKTGSISKLSNYRLRDNYLRFYLKYLAPNKDMIKKGLFETRAISTLPGWHAMMGLQFENLCLNNSLSIAEKIGIPKEDVIFIGPYFQRARSRAPGCQIDLLIQTKYNSLFVCEIKFSVNAIGKPIIEEIEEKINRMTVAKSFSVWPVLIHVNGITSSVIESEYFSKIINFGDLL